MKMSARATLRNICCRLRDEDAWLVHDIVEDVATDSLRVTGVVASNSRGRSKEEMEALVNLIQAAQTSTVCLEIKCQLIEVLR